MTNVFIATDGTLTTPALARCGVAGVTRERLIDAAREHGVTCTVADLKWSKLVDADEVVLVNTLAGVWSVREIDGSPRTPGPLARAMQDWLERDDA
jgi:4-amino-4-deoxychorismate lyase